MKLFLFIYSLFILVQVAIASTNNSLSLSGFGTLAATKAGDDNLGFYREFNAHNQTGDWSLKTDSILGIQANLEFNEKFSANLQLVAKDRAKQGLNESVEWANFKYRINNKWTLRGGRLGNDVYMLSDIKNVSYAYLWSRPIIEFYQPIVKSNIDGIDLTYSHQFNEGALSYKINTGRSSPKLSGSGSYFKMDFADIYGFSVNYTDIYWRYRFGAQSSKVIEMKDLTNGLNTGLAQIPEAIWPGITEVSDRLKSTNKQFTYYSLGISYERDWLVQSEIGYLDSEWTYFPSVYSGYLSVGKRIGSFTPYVVFSKIKPAEDKYNVSSPSRPGVEAMPGLSFGALQKIAQGIIDSTQADQQTLSIGVRWDLDSQLALKAQWSHTQINDGKSALWAQFQYPNNISSMDTFSLQLDFVF